MTEKLLNADNGEPEVVFSRREIEVLNLLVQDYTNEEIANALNISFRTVESHRKNMIQRTGTANIAGLLQYAKGKGLLK